MSDELQRESLSALVDGELPDAQARRLLDAMRDDPELREQWRRHHRLSALLAGRADTVGDDGALAARIRVALEREPAPRARGRRVAAAAAPRSGRRLALAAGVVLAAVVVALGVGGERDGAPETVAGPTPAPETVAGPTPAPVTVGAAAAGAALEQDTRLTWNGARPGVEARLNAYLLNHNEYLADGVRGMLPYARVVGYDARD